MSERFLDGRVELHCGDCLEAMEGMAENSVDSCVTDPPYHLTSIVKRFGAENAAPARNGKTGNFARISAGFIGRTWDGGDVAFRPDTWSRALHVMKPGAYLVAFSSTRTFARMTVAIEDAGFIVHPFVAWVFGQGFPKAHRITASGLTDLDRATGGWDGWRYGTQALKPAIEPICVAQKPFEDGLTGTQNVMKWGVGALNIDGCRVEGGERPARELDPKDTNNNVYDGRVNGDASFKGGSKAVGTTDLGRWPANLAHDGSPEVTSLFPEQESGGTPSGRASDKFGNTYGDFRGREHEEGIGSTAGSAARFYYTAKADADDRLGSSHPTVKPVDLIRWLVRLVTPPGGLVLDPFAGTGTTGEAAWLEGMRAVLIERETEYQGDIRRRMALALAGPMARATETAKAKEVRKPVNLGPLFGGT